MPASKIPEYISQRLSGLAPMAAGLAAGYAPAGLKVTVCQLEARADVKKAVKSGKAPAGVGKLRKPVPPRGQKSDEDDVPEELKPWKLQDRYASPLELLIDVMNNPKCPGGLRIQCAKDALPYCHARKEGSKTQDKNDRAKQTASKSAFGTMPTPRASASGHPAH